MEASFVGTQTFELINTEYCFVEADRLHSGK